MAEYKDVPVKITFNTLGMTEATAALGLKAYIQKIGEKEFVKAVAAKLGSKAIPIAGWAVVVLDFISAGMICAGYGGFTFTAKCLIKTTTKHQAGQTFTVTQCQPIAITKVSTF